MYPSFARPSLAFLLIAWSAGLSLLWRLDVTIAATFCLTAGAVAGMFLSARSVKDDQRAFYVYNVSRRRELTDVSSNLI